MLEGTGSRKKKEIRREMKGVGKGGRKARIKNQGNEIGGTTLRESNREAGQGSTMTAKERELN